MTQGRWIVTLFLAFAAAIPGLAWLYYSHGVSEAAEVEDLLAVQCSDFAIYVNAPGILESGRSVSIGPPKIPNEYRFKLARIVEEGKEVSEGDFLLEFDGSDIGRRLREETANLRRIQEEYQKKRSDLDIQQRDLKLQLEQAKAELDKLENKLSRQAELESGIVVAETQIKRDTAKKRVELLERKLGYLSEGGRLDLEMSRSNENHYKSRMDRLLGAMDSLTVTAPVPGVVIYKRDWNNEPRQVGSFVFVLDSVVELPDLSTIRAKVMVDEVDAGRVRVGQEAKVLVDAVQGKVLTGKVTALGAILKQAAFARPQKVAEALVELRGPDLKPVRPGMSAKAQILVGQHRGAIVIPLSSVTERDGLSYVQVWNAKKRAFEWREVQLSTSDGLLGVVSSGLQVSEKIRSNVMR